ncbi:gamma-glutamylcyclotransferase family protein [Mesorhizobium sp. LHD-90]|uniref:gamma-glutamylcyclotransferase family protein n=1 Tax=Mesorhizobium sp. LHD-90 TaxID=3071414 RepID=UPI0027E1149D|nr:gamma-glutamylcyclotransferase family protein [Mesorhizobium sp. LHD-90]MDQ6436203.1 gamma-glutamylcyclotransferase family protein [Mesorhizobium sp. LHD-90]
MLKATDEEIENIREYFEWQAPDLEVTFMQKVYSEAVLSTHHDVWDIHTNKDRWWVITGGTNLYSQEQFPNMDLALTFHIGLILRIPRTEKQQEDDLRILPFGPVFEKLEEAGTAVTQAQNLTGYQAVGVRCREVLLELIGVAQDSAKWTDSPPQRANFRAWTEIICNDLLPSDTNKERRGALKGALETAWTFSNWLTHSKSATWIDADMAHSLLQHATGMATSLILRELRGVPEECPTCGSPHLEPDNGENTAAPGIIWERPRCTDCGWTGRPVPIIDLEDGQPIITREGEKSDEHSIMAVPLRTILKPGDLPIEPSKKREAGPPEPVVYFAYGSNMSTARLRKRMPSCEPLGIAILPGHTLRFHKRSTDKSGKCNAFASGNNRSVIGVLFSFDPTQRDKLDEAEGVGSGYEHAMVTVINDKGRRRKVLTYLATPDYIDDSLKPYSWYKDFVLAGGREHGLPPEYIAEYIQSVEAIDDPSAARDKKQRATLANHGL